MTHTSHLLSLLSEITASPRFTQVLTGQPLQEVLVNALAEGEAKKPMVVVCAHSKDVHRLREHIYLPNRQKIKLLHTNFWGNERYSNHRMETLSRISCFASLSLQGDEPSPVIFSTLAGLLQATPPQGWLTLKSISCNIQDEIDPDLFTKQLEDMGYLSTHQVVEKGNFCLRGGVLDIFHCNSEHPVRIEFFGDRIHSLRFFDTRDQRGGNKEIQQCTIFPASWNPMSQGERKYHVQKFYEFLLNSTATLAERNGLVEAFLLGHDTACSEVFAPIIFPSLDSIGAILQRQNARFVFWDPIESCRRQYAQAMDKLESLAFADRSQNKATTEISLHFPKEPTEFLNASLAQSMEFGNPLKAVEGNYFQHPDQLIEAASRKLKGTGAVKTPTQSFWVEQLLESLDQGTMVMILCQHEAEISECEEIFLDSKTPLVRHPNPLSLLSTFRYQPGAIHLGYGRLSRYLMDDGVFVLNSFELLGRGRKQRPSGESSAANLKKLSLALDSLKPNDLVVHKEHGVGICRGLSRIALEGKEQDFVVVEYQNSDKVFVPMDHLHKLQRYQSGSSQSPKLDRLGNQSWEGKKQKVEKAAAEIAKKILETAALREVARSRSFSDPPEMYFQMVDDFPYEETADQLRAIDEINEDFNSAKAMDRILVGDVGFGKTEVAMRASMRAVCEGWQVLVLVPTTILCYQHFQNFKERFEKFGISVAHASRFVSKKDQDEIFSRLSVGKLDILIGTHRILSKDVTPKKLGLVIIDEEHRFGVEQKERLKELRNDAHILSLTATPIPRTLHMATIGLRDISLLTTPPGERRAVKTMIAEYDFQTIISAITFETSRGGQVFYVHNTISDLEEIARKLSEALPKLSFRFAYGQMKEEQLEDLMLQFMEKKFHVLICTTIIESGVDMPNVNTMIIDDAHKYGLSQLHQLRGRVGRAKVQAYTYLFCPKGFATEDSMRRLTVLQSHQELGSGFQISNHDMEIRGVGSLLGHEQAGHIASVGMELYSEMLSRAISDLRGQKQFVRIDSEVKIKIQALIPKQYILQEADRIRVYKRIFAADSENELDEILAETTDRYGSPAQELKNLFLVAALKLKLSDLQVLKLTQLTSGKFNLKFSSLKEKVLASIMIAVKNRPGFYLKPDFSLDIILDGLSEEKVLKKLIQQLSQFHTALEG